MNFPQIFRGVKRLGIDTSPLIYYIEENPNYDKVINEVFRHFELNEFEINVSALALTEVMSYPIQLGNSEIATLYYSFLTETTGIRVVTAGVEVSCRAADLRAKYSLKTIDAIHLATAVESGCDAFLTNDFTFKRITEIRVLILDDL